MLKVIVQCLVFAAVILHLVALLLGQSHLPELPY